MNDHDSESKRESDLVTLGLEYLSQGFSIFDKDLKLVKWNSSMEQLLDFPSGFLTKGLPLEELFRFNAERGEYGEGDSEEMVAKRLKKAKLFEDHHFERARPDGTILEVSGSALPAGGFVTTYTDITNRKKTEKALETSETRFRSYFELGLIGMAVTSIEKGWLYVNDHLCNLLGYSNEELTQLTWADITHPEDLAADEAEFNKVLAREIDGYAMDKRFIRKNGDIIYASISVKCLEEESNRIDQFIALVQDITERKKAEQLALDQKEQFTQNLLDRTTEGFWHTDNDGKTLDVNPAMCEILGRPREEIIGRSLLDFVDDENAEIFSSELKKRKEGFTGSYEVALLRPDGTQAYCLNNATPIFDENDRLVGSVGLFTDITPIREITLKMERAKFDAELANKSKSQFLANMSHELRTPLNAIIGFTDAINHEIFGAIQPDNYKSYVRDINKAGYHLLHLVNDILDMSKIEAGKFIIHVENVALEVIAEEALTMVRGRAKENGIQIVTNLPNDLPQVAADQRATLQALLNLLTNAVKFTNSGGKIQIDAEVEKPYVVFTVSDTGVGMNQTDIERALQPFVQIEREKGRGHEGTGLGLSLTTKLIELQGGEFTIKSAVGKGTTACFTLPISSRTVDQGSSFAKPEYAETQLWLDSMSVGVDAWDLDHQVLFHQIDELIAAIEEKRASQEIETIIKTLSSYCDLHLNSEENAMRQLNYPGLIEHKAKHDEFRAWFKSQLGNIIRSPSEWDARGIGEYLVNWWHNHILTVDMAYKEFFEDRIEALREMLDGYDGLTKPKTKSPKLKRRLLDKQ